LVRIKREQAIKIAEKREKEFLKKMDKEDNIRRINQIKELRKRQIMEKIEKDNFRTEHIMAKRQEMMQMRF
jgi:hypothetical protein